MGMDCGHLIRRAVHMSAPLLLIYYALPDPLFGMPRAAFAMSILALAMVVELVRLIICPEVVGMRCYERTQVSAAAWAAFGAVTSMVLFPIGIVAPAICGMAFVDPLIGELRCRGSRLHPLLPAAVYLVMTTALLSLSYGIDSRIVLAASMATAVAIGVESLSSHLVDDDFLMVVAPLLVLHLVI